ncbi:glucose 1-dehydrogenase [Lysobacter sp. A6]|uniref:Glucose 1-dehydrogenase n=1 Tax=Noviluteimonas lactosilytica TaxID=2888523 RepID=A0ABS8JM18_9GAMM|nr:glucose 1-dehydrogenase [Lysobacter lactosilyticus]MCC8364668.1 glucose 1-dehydrogenase [Lysobacter lactosilyticus]
MNRVKGKTCIVTGAALGIGAATARRLAEEGARVALFDLRDDDGRRLADSLHAAGADARYWRVDVTSENSVKSAMDGVADTWGGIDVLVNNAGIAGANKPTHEITEAEWDAVQAVNVKGVFFCTKHVIRHMRRAGSGSIVNLSSIYGLVGAPDVPPYHASKGAVTLMTRTDALLYATDRIRVNSVHPGYIWTPMVEHHLRDSGATDLAAARQEVGALHPLGHMGEPDDIAWGIVYLASDESKFMTGAELVIDGGYTAR